MTTLNIILGNSFFSGTVVVGVALNNHNDCVESTKWAERVAKGGRPASVQAVTGKRTIEQVERHLRTVWTEWAAREGVDICVTKGRREVARSF